MIGAFGKGTLVIANQAEGVVVLGKDTLGEIEMHLPITAEEFRAAVESRLPNTPRFIVDMFSFLAEHIEMS